LGQKVANYPGVTVERKEGSWTIGDRQARLIDLPGLYSLDATSIDEHIASDVLRGEVSGLATPDAVVAVVDATNLERNLYLVTQLFEYNVPVVVALTMIDVFEKQQHEIDINKLSKSLGVPVIAVNASADRGVEVLAEAVSASLTSTRTPKFELNG
jgi:ferrous iron transport protein B